jgi:hypothetical protein
LLKEPPNDDDDDDDGVIVVGGGEPAAHNSSEEEGPQPVVTPATSTVVAAMPPRHLSYASPQPTIQPALSSTSSQRRDGISEGGDSYTIGQIGSDCIPNDKDRVALMKDLTTQMSKHQMQCKTVDNAHQLKQNEHQLALSEHQIRGQIEVMETQHRMDMESKRLDADINASATSATVAANAGPAAAAAATAAALAAVEVPATAAAAAAAAVPAAAVNDYGLVCNFVSPTKTMPKHIELQNALNQCPFNHRFRQGNACSPNALYSKLRNYECNKTGCGI